MRYAAWVAAGLLLAALLHWPYAYYQFLRICVCGIGAVAAWHLCDEKRWSAAGIAAAGAVAFNPILPLHMEREQWALLNVLFAVGFLIVGFSLPKPSKAGE